MSQVGAAEAIATEATRYYFTLGSALSGLELEHEPVAVDGLDVRGPAGELGRVDRGDPAREDGAVRADELDAVARPEVALPAADADGEQARAAVDDRLRAPASTATGPATRLPCRSQSLNADAPSPAAKRVPGARPASAP